MDERDYKAMNAEINKPNKSNNIKKLLCILGLHNWQIGKWARYRDIKCKYLIEEGFDRACQRCGKRQRLQRPEKYHPSKFVWMDLPKHPPFS